MKRILRVRYDTREELAKITKGAIYYCYQCGTCTASCLLSPVLSTRKLLRYMQLGLIESVAEQVWSCVTCRYCELQCPHQIPIVEIVRGARIKLYESKRVPEQVNEPLWSIYEEGNPLAMPRRERTMWAKGLKLSRKPDIAIYVCCLSAYDRRLQRTLRKLIEVISSAGYNVGIVGDAMCCGDVVYHIGETGFFEELAKTNVEAIEAVGASIIVTLSPHCHYALVELYPRFGAKPSTKVLHYTQLLAQILREGRIEAKYAHGNTRVTYHDPCYLGRWLGIYDEPRSVIRSIEGIELVEMPRNRENSTCCGGGGGSMWLENRASRKLARNRLYEARSIEAKILVTACPYCIRMFEDEERVARTGLGINDVVELVSRVH